MQARLRCLTCPHMPPNAPDRKRWLIETFLSLTPYMCRLNASAHASLMPDSGTILRQLTKLPRQNADMLPSAAQAQRVAELIN